MGIETQAEEAPRKGVKLSELEAGSSKQLRAQACARTRGTSSPGPSARPNGQEGVLSRSCPLPGLGQRGRPLPTCLLLFQESVALSLNVTDIHFLAPGNPSLPTPAQPRAQDSKLGEGSKEQEDPQGQTRIHIARCSLIPRSLVNTCYLPRTT